jgi:cytochrome P450
MSDLSDLVRLEDPSFYFSDPYPVIARLHEEEPVSYYPPLDMWVLSKYHDIQHSGRTPLVFSTTKGFHLNDLRYGMTSTSMFPPGAELVTVTPPPRHGELRKSIAPSFSPKAMSQLEDRIRVECRQLLEAIPRGEEIDFTEALAVPLPITVIAMLLGMPVEDHGRVLAWSDAIMTMGANLSKEEIAAAAASLGPMRDYFTDLIDRRLREPADDILSTLVAAWQAGAMSYETVHLMVSALMTAGNETTRNALSGGIALLATHPAEYAKLAGDPSLAKSATEELLRFVSVVRGFARTVEQDTEIRGQKMTAGQRVFNFHMAGNFDPEIFPDPFTLHLDREFKVMSMAFGFGEYACPGMALARLELRVAWEELARRFSAVRLASSPVPDLDVLFANQWKSVPVVLD